MMAATLPSSSSWGRKPGTWALEAEEQEEELRRIQDEEDSSTNDDAFPSLAVAAATKQPKKNKKMSLAEFNSAATKSSGLTPDEMLSLPTGPRRRSPEELDRNRLGGGFQSYGYGNNRSGDDGYGNSRPSRFSNREGRERDRDRERERERDYIPSRADEVDDWSKTKKSPSTNGGFERRERNGGSLFEGSASKADESDNWAAGKVAVEPRRFEKRGSFDSLSRGRDSYGQSGGGSDSDTWGRRKDESNGTGTGTGIGSRPKLVLQPRTLPVSNTTAEVTNGKPKSSNPFGEARPREEVLAEKGKDWKEIDDKLESTKVSLPKDSDRGDRKEPYGWRKERVRSTNDDGAFEKSWRKEEGSVPEARNQSIPDNGHTANNEESTEDSVEAN